VLVTTLGAGDYILLGADVRVHFDHKVDKDTLAIAIEAPKEFSVLRKKLIEKGATPKPRTVVINPEYSRLLVTLNANEDYVMIGDDITIKHKGNKGHSFSIGIAAPKDVKITRKSVYEEKVEKMALAGDASAQKLIGILKEQNEERRKISAQRQAKQQRYKSNHIKNKDRNIV